MPLGSGKFGSHGGRKKCVPPPPPSGCIGRGGRVTPRPLLPGGPSYAQPLPLRRQVPASMAFLTNSNRPQPLWQPPPPACLTASVAGSEIPPLLMHPCPPFPHPCLMKGCSALRILLICFMCMAPSASMHVSVYPRSLGNLQQATDWP